VNRKVRRLHVPRAGSRPRCRLSLAVTGPYIARIASDPERRTAAAEEVVAIAVSWGRHFANGGHLARTKIATSNG
jgi:hypothetical protein